MKNKFLLLLSLSIVCLCSCEKDDSFSYDVSSKTGYYVLNEGAWGKSNSSIGFIQDGGDYAEELFFRINNRPLGDVLMSLTINPSTNLGYLVLNSSNKIEIINSNNFAQKGVIENLDSPRNMVINANKGYVSQWGENGCVKVIDLASNVITKTIQVGAGPEGMIIANGKLWVANSGGYGHDNTISVIDLDTEEVIQTIAVGDNPLEFAIDSNSDLWVLCYGYIEYNQQDYSVISESPSQLIRISAQTNIVDQTYTISANAHPMHLTINPAGNTLYYGGGYGFDGIYSMAIDAVSVTATPLITGYFYAVDCNPTNGDIATTLSPSFTEPGSIKIYTPAGTEINSFVAGIGPRSVIYKN